MMLNIGILGCGRIGQVHIASIAQIPGARVAAVADAVPGVAADTAAACGARALETEALIADPGVDAVVIGTPTTTHFDLIHAAAAAGKAIFCEKPVDLSVDRIRTCAEAVASAGVPFMTAFNRRFDPGFAAMGARIATGEIGAVELVTILSRDPSPPPVGYIKASGGIFRDMMIHDLDMARFLTGLDVVEVHATGSCLVDPAIGEAGDVDTAAVTLRMASGAICQISNSRRASYGYDQRVEVHGAKGLLRAENHRRDNLELATEAGFLSAPAQPFFLERYAAAYRAEMLHFVSSLQSGAMPSPTLADGLAAQILADAAATSLATGRPVTVTA